MKGGEIGEVNVPWRGLNRSLPPSLTPTTAKKGGKIYITVLNSHLFHFR